MKPSNKRTYCLIHLTSKFNSMELLLFNLHWLVLKVEFSKIRPTAGTHLAARLWMARVSSYALLLPLPSYTYEPTLVIFGVFLYTALSKPLAARDGRQERLWNASLKKLIQLTFSGRREGRGELVEGARFAGAHLWKLRGTPTAPHPLIIWRMLIDTLLITKA